MNAYIVAGHPARSSYGAGCWRVDAETKAKALEALNAVVNEEFKVWELEVVDTFPSKRRRPKVVCCYAAFME